jgi:uncharacterized protein YkwD
MTGCGNRLPRALGLLYLAGCCCAAALSLTAPLAYAAGEPAIDSGTFARQLLAETNLARTQPKRYAEFVRQLRPSFLGNVYRAPGSGSMVVTAEGARALDEAVQFLSRQQPLAPLEWSAGLADAAEDLVRDEGQTGQVGHTGRNSGDMRQRIERHGSWQRSIAENIGYGPDSARLMVMELIIDDGVPGRGHRRNIFGRDFTVAGASFGAHAVYRTICVMDFAGGFRSSRP